MKYKVVLSRQAEKAFLHLNPGDFLAVSRVNHSLEEDPWSARSESVRSITRSGTNLYSVRARDYRVIYSVDVENKIVFVERIARRNEKTYKGL